MGVAHENRYKQRVWSANDESGDRKAQRDILKIVREPRKLVHSPEPLPTKQQVKKWMIQNADEYETATGLAEAANIEFDMPESWLDDELHWIWELADRYA